MKTVRGRDANRERQYRALILDPIRVCRRYRPRFGTGKALTLEEFKKVYGADSFYSWLGMDSPLLYAAHRAGGGMTSLYRQIGIGCQRLVQQLIMDELGQTIGDSSWSYSVRAKGNMRRLTLDARIQLDGVAAPAKRKIISRWLERLAVAAGFSKAIVSALNGCVFEVRQGYKSKDSKRQNADIASAGAAIGRGYLPILMLFSSQIDEDVADRYRTSGWVILRGTENGSAGDSTYEFWRDVVGYDLAAFFKRNSRLFRTEVNGVLKALLR